MEATSIRFAAAARCLGRAARARGLRVPGFRSPPRIAGAERTLRRARSGSATVAVVVKGRPWSAVLADLVDGVVAANGLRGTRAERTRTELWAALEADGLVAASPCPGRGTLRTRPDRPPLHALPPPPPPPPPAPPSAGAGGPPHVSAGPATVPSPARVA